MRPAARAHPHGIMKIRIAYDRSSGRADLLWTADASATFGKRYNVSMSAEPLQRVAQRLHPSVFTALTSIDAFSVPITKRETFENLLRRLAADAALGRDAERSTFELLVALVENANGPADAETVRARDVVLSAIKFIDDRYSHPISLRDVASSVGLSAGYLTGFMRHYTGRTVQRWIVHRRIAEAAKLLAETLLPINVVSDRVGYDDRAYFTRQFQRIAGVSPREWRRVTQQVAAAEEGVPYEFRARDNFDVSPLFGILDASNTPVDAMKEACRLVCDMTSAYRIDAACRNDAGGWNHRATCDANVPLLAVTPTDDDWGLRLMTLGLPYTKSALDTSEEPFHKLLAEIGATAVYASPVFRKGGCVGCVAVSDGINGPFTNYERGLVDLASALLSLGHLHRGS